MERPPVRANSDQKIVSLRQIMLHQPKRFAKQALDAVTSNRRADVPAYADAQSRIPKIIWKAPEGERPARFADGAVADRVEYAATAYSLRPRQRYCLAIGLRLMHPMRR